MQSYVYHRIIHFLYEFIMQLTNYLEGGVRLSISRLAHSLFNELKSKRENNHRNRGTK